MRRATAPAGTAWANLRAVYQQDTNLTLGSAYFDDASLSPFVIPAGSSLTTEPENGPLAIASPCLGPETTPDRAAWDDTGLGVGITKDQV